MDCANLNLESDAKIEFINGMTRRPSEVGNINSAARTIGNSKIQFVIMIQ